MYLLTPDYLLDSCKLDSLLKFQNIGAKGRDLGCLAGLENST